MKCDGCFRPARAGRTACEVCAARSAARYQRKKAQQGPRATLQGNATAQKRQASREDERALMWLKERGWR
jgi:hypothetical protein